MKRRLLCIMCCTITDSRLSNTNRGKRCAHISTKCKMHIATFWLIVVQKSFFWKKYSSKWSRMCHLVSQSHANIRDYQDEPASRKRLAGYSRHTVMAASLSVLSASLLRLWGALWRLGSEKRKILREWWVKAKSHRWPLSCLLSSWQRRQFQEEKSNIFLEHYLPASFKFFAFWYQQTIHGIKNRFLSTQLQSS